MACAGVKFEWHTMLHILKSQNGWRGSQGWIWVIPVLLSSVLYLKHVIK